MTPRPPERESLRLVHQLSDDSIMRYRFEKARRSFARFQKRYERNIRNQTEQHFISAT